MSCKFPRFIFRDILTYKEEDITMKYSNEEKLSIITRYQQGESAIALSMNSLSLEAPYTVGSTPFRQTARASL